MHTHLRTYVQGYTYITILRLTSIPKRSELAVNLLDLSMLLFCEGNVHDGLSDYNIIEVRHISIVFHTHADTVTYKVTSYSDHT